MVLINKNTSNGFDTVFLRISARAGDRLGEKFASLEGVLAIFQLGAPSGRYELECFLVCMLQA